MSFSFSPASTWNVKSQRLSRARGAVFQVNVSFLPASSSARARSSLFRIPRYPAGHSSRSPWWSSPSPPAAALAPAPRPRWTRWRWAFRPSGCCGSPPGLFPCWAKSRPRAPRLRHPRSPRPPPGCPSAVSSRWPKMWRRWRRCECGACRRCGWPAGRASAPGRNTRPGQSRGRSSQGWLGDDNTRLRSHSTRQAAVNVWEQNLWWPHLWCVQMQLCCCSEGPFPVGLIPYRVCLLRFGFFPPQCTPARQQKYDPLPLCVCVINKVKLQSKMGLSVLPFNGSSSELQLDVRATEVSSVSSRGRDEAYGCQTKAALCPPRPVHWDLHNAFGTCTPSSDSPPEPSRAEPNPTTWPIKEANGQVSK